MKYFAIGLFLGTLINFLPIFNFETGIAVFPEWTGSISKNGEIRTSPFIESGKADFIIDSANSFLKIDTSGHTNKVKSFDDSILHNLSGNGKYYITYEKIGNEIAFYNSDDEIFWKHVTPQYPYLSYNGKFILLLIADLSGVIIIDSNSNSTGAGEISGKLLNSIYLTQENDYASVGFIDGSYYALNAKGEIIYAGSCGKDYSVKTTAMSPNGKYIIVHYGSEKNDGAIMTDLEKSKSYNLPITGVHLTKTAVCITDEGCFSIIDGSKILTSEINSKKVISINIPEQIPGECSITFHKNLFYAVFRTTGGSAVYAYDASGNVVFSKIFPEEQFLQQKFADNSLILRGIDNLFCYTFLN
ncbi:MAG: hypothetical protein JW982_15275 [Spirochaetes bacterium]|nr:hypothetical protein [Spirochaetota bacterium]